MFGIAHGVVDALDQILPPADPDVSVDRPDRQEMQHRAPPPRTPVRSSSAYAARAAATRREPAQLPPGDPPPVSTSTLVRGKYHVIPATNEAQQAVWVVTDGVDYAVCSSPEFAQRVRGSLG